MFVLLNCTFLCMHLPQAAPLPPSLGIERDIFRCRHQVEEVKLELAVVGCSVVVPFSPATSLQSRQLLWRYEPGKPGGKT